MNRKQQSGFSLVELMIALAIFSVVSAASFVGLNSAIRSYTFFIGEAKEQTRSEIFIALITKDFLQIVPRVIRDANGDYQPAFKLGGSYLVEFSRSGLPILGKGTGVSRIAYKLDATDVWRYSWSYLDNIRTTEPSKSLILKDVKKLDIIAINETLQTAKRWPTTQSFDDEKFAQLPQAIEITVEVQGEGKMSRFIPGVSSVYINTQDGQKSTDIEDDSAVDEELTDSDASSDENN